MNENTRTSLQGRVAAHSLTNDEKVNVEKIIRSCVPPYRFDDYKNFVSGCRSAADKLPSVIHRWSELAKEANFGIIHNLPIDALLPATPTERHVADHISMLADGVIGTISALFGTIYFFEGKKTVRHIQNIYPIAEDACTQLAGASKTSLEWHVEDAFLPNRAHWIAFLCLRGDAEAETRIARAKDLQLSPQEIHVLRQPQYKLKIDETFGENIAFSHVTVSILSNSNNDPEIIFDPFYTLCSNQEAIDSLANVSDAANQVCEKFTLRKGDLLVLNNRRAIHSRSAFHARMDGSDRWIKRSLILENLEWSPKLKNGFISIVIDEQEQN